MNRRLLRTTYHAEVEEVNFTHGLPAWMTQALTGLSTASTHDYTDPYGSHYAMIARGKAGEGVTLAGSPLSTSVVKVLELEAIGVTVDGPAELSLGLMSPNDGVAGIQLEAVPIDAGVAQAGRVRLLLRDGSSEGKRTLFAEGNDGQILDGGTVIDDVDLARNKDRAGAPGIFLRFLLSSIAKLRPRRRTWDIPTFPAVPTAFRPGRCWLLGSGRPWSRMGRRRRRCAG